MENSILKSIKHLLQIGEDDTTFDNDVILHINSALADLNLLGIGPKNGFFIEDDQANWTDFFGVDSNLNNVKQYVYLKVRLVFDPPTNSALLASINQLIGQLEWRINVYRENLEWAALGLNVPDCTTPDPTDSLVSIYQHAKE